jgi:hypothetical protein
MVYAAQRLRNSFRADTKPEPFYTRTHTDLFARVATAGTLSVVLKKKNSTNTIFDIGTLNVVRDALRAKFRDEGLEFRVQRLRV